MAKTYPKRLLEFAQEHIPLLRTYLEREEKRDIDKLIRDELVKKLQELIDQLNQAKQKLVDSGRLAGLDLLDRTTHKLEKIRDSIRFASRGYRGVFDLEQMAEEELDRLIEFDQKLFGKISVLKEKLQQVLSRPQAELKSALGEFDREIEEFDSHLEERDKYALEKEGK